MKLFAAEQAYSLQQDGYETLHLAASIGNHKSLHTMLEAGLDNTIRDDVRMALFNIALTSRNQAVLRVLLSQPCLQLHMQDQKGRSLFHLAATQYNANPLSKPPCYVDFLLDFCKRVPHLQRDFPQTLNTQNNRGETAFWHSVSYQAFEMIDRFLAELDVNINVAPPGKPPAVWVAVYNLCNILGNDRLHHNREGASLVLKKILQRKDLSIVSLNNRCSLCFSIQFLSVDIVKHVLQRSDIPLQRQDHICPDLVQTALDFRLDQEPKIEQLLRWKYFELSPQRAFQVFTDFVDPWRPGLAQALVQREWLTTSWKNESGSNALEVAIGANSLRLTRVLLTNMNWSHAELEVAKCKANEEIKLLIWRHAIAKE